MGMGAQRFIELVLVVMAVCIGMASYQSKDWVRENQDEAARAEVYYLRAWRKAHEKESPCPKDDYAKGTSQPVRHRRLALQP
jgi:hypothetical protein